MTLLQVIDMARSIVNEPLSTARTFPDNTSSFWRDSILTDYHNLIQTEVAEEINSVFEDFFITQTTVSLVGGTAQYNLPSDFVKMRRVEDTRVSSPIPVEPITLNQKSAYHYIPVFSQTDMLGGYYIRGTQIVFDNTPATSAPSAITLHYIKRLPDVTAASSSSEIPAEHHRALVWGTVRLMLFQQQSDTTMAQAEFEKHMQRIKQMAEDRQIQRPRRVVNTKERII